MGTASGPDSPVLSSAGLNPSKHHRVSNVVQNDSDRQTALESSNL